MTLALYVNQNTRSKCHLTPEINAVITLMLLTAGVFSTFDKLVWVGFYSYNVNVMLMPLANIRLYIMLRRAVVHMHMNNEYMTIYENVLITFCNHLKLQYERFVKYTIM